MIEGAVITLYLVSSDSILPGMFFGAEEYGLSSEHVDKAWVGEFCETNERLEEQCLGSTLDDLIPEIAVDWEYPDSP